MRYVYGFIVCVIFFGGMYLIHKHNIEQYIVKMKKIVFDVIENSDGITTEEIALVLDESVEDIKRILSEIHHAKIYKVDGKWKKNPYW